MSGDEWQAPATGATEAVAESADPRVDAALRRSADLAATPPVDHVEIYEDVHRTLQEVLADAADSGDAGATELSDGAVSDGAVSDGEPADDDGDASR